MFKILLTTTLLMIPGFLLSQGVTTASLNGTIKTQAGESSVGANVVAIHEPERFDFWCGLTDDGRCNIPGIPVGGPYTY